MCAAGWRPEWLQDGLFATMHVHAEGCHQPNVICREMQPTCLCPVRRAWEEDSTPTGEGWCGARVHLVELDQAWAIHLEAVQML